jgi:uncharacterized membrane protein
MWDGSHDMGGWMIVWMTLGGLTWVLLAALLASVITGGWNRRNSDRERQSPLDVSRRRYASGELSEDEFERIRGNLN